MNETQKELEKLRTLQESLDFYADVAENQLPALADKIDNIDLTPIENKVDEGVSTLSAKIDNIKLPEIDTTELAKEATLNEVSNKIDNLNSGDGGDIGEKLQQIIDANILKPNLQGITFVDGEATNDVAALIAAGAPSIVSIGSETMNKGIKLYAFNSCSNLREVNFPLATSIGNYAFQYCSNLREANFPLATSIGSSTFSGDANLIKLILGGNLANSINLSTAAWNPTNAYSTTSRSLVPEDVQAEHPLWYNLDYLLYNIRECIAANLPDRTGQSALTITFNATMKGHINNSEETVEAFTSKNWTIA